MISQKYLGHARKIATAAAAALVLSACGGGDPTPPTSPTPPTPTPPTPTPPTPTPPTPTPPTPTPTGPTGDRLEQQDNIFAWAEQNNVPMHVNPWWSEHAAEEPGGAAIADYNTGVWMDRIGAIESYTGIPGLPDQGPNLTQDGEESGLRWHLDNALEQGNDEYGALFHFVVYDLPGRDCSAVASNGELPADAEGMRLYREEYIGRIMNILSDEQYARVPVVAIIEIDSLPNLVTNPDDCVDVDNTKEWGYTNNIRYAINELSQLSNVHIYVDAGHSGWLGWDDDLDVATMFMTGVIDGFDGLPIDSLVTDIQNTDGNTGKYDEIASSFVEPPASPGAEAPGFDKISGFITNTANYTPLAEPNLPNPEEDIGGEPVRSAQFYDWNPRFGELEYTADWLAGLANWGADTSGLGMLIDTGRNGWGGPPSASSGSTPTEHVDANRLDRRPHRGSWCNLPGGVGERPGLPASDLSSRYEGTTAHIDAFVWTKPQGESDGTSDPNFTPDPNDANKAHDPMCDPDAENRYAEEADSTAGQGIGTGALPNAPHAGRWYSEAFQVLVENAYPEL